MIEDLDLYSNKEYDRAIADYTQDLKLQPNDIEAYYQRGLAYRDKGSKQNATDDFKKVLELAKDAKLRRQAEQELKKLEVK